MVLELGDFEKERAMKKLTITLCVTIILSFISGCAYNVAFKAPDNHQYTESVPLNTAFYMDKTLKDKMYYGRAFSSGIANRWDVPVGDAIHMYATANLKNGFANFYELETLNEKPTYDLLIKLNEINYYMEGQAAHCNLAFVVENSSGKQVFSKTYHADGPSGYGRIIAAGAFAQKSAIRQSTHVVMENIFSNFINDIRVNYSSWDK